MTNKDTPEMVTAHELGQFTYCREAWRLATLGVQPSQVAQQRMAAGEVEHDRWQRREDRRARARRRLGWRGRLVRLVVVAALLFLLFENVVRHGCAPH